MLLCSLLHIQCEEARLFFFFCLFVFFCFSSGQKMKGFKAVRHWRSCSMVFISEQSRRWAHGGGLRPQLKSTDPSLAAPDSTSSSLICKVTVKTKASVIKRMDLKVSEVLFYRNIWIIEIQWGRAAMTATVWEAVSTYISDTWDVSVLNKAQWRGVSAPSVRLYTVLCNQPKTCAHSQPGVQLSSHNVMWRVKSYLRPC